MPGKTIFGTDRRDVIDHLDGVTNQGDFIFGTATTTISSDSAAMTG